MKENTEKPKNCPELSNFFKNNGKNNIKSHMWGNLESYFTVEEMYQAFKERMLADIVNSFNIDSERSTALSNFVQLNDDHCVNLYCWGEHLESVKLEDLLELAKYQIIQDLSPSKEIER